LARKHKPKTEFLKDPATGYLKRIGIGKKELEKGHNQGIGGEDIPLQPTFLGGAVGQASPPPIVGSGGGGKKTGAADPSGIGGASAASEIAPILAALL